MVKFVNTAVPRERVLCATDGRAAIAARRDQLEDPHVRDLTAWTKSIRDRLDPCHSKTVCEFDPLGGGVDAKILYLAQDPSSTASKTGFISPDNNDATASETTKVCDQTGLKPHERIHWNVYPWWVNAPCETQVPTPTALAQQFLAEFLDLLPNVVSVVLIGKKARTSWARLARDQPIRSGIRTWHGPHPSHGWWDKPYSEDPDGRLGRAVIIDALEQAAEYARG